MTTKAGETIFCKLLLENGVEYVSVKPGLFLSNLITIKVLPAENLEHPLKLERIQPKTFKVNLLFSRLDLSDSEFIVASSILKIGSFLGGSR